MTSKIPDIPSEAAAPDTPGDAPDPGAAAPASQGTAMHHDALFRYAFSDPVHAAAVLQVILPPEAARHIDWKSLQPVHASTVGDAGKQLHGDLVFKALLTDGRSAFLWLLFEHQSTIDPWMIWRMTGMAWNFLRTWRRQHPDARCLPAVLPVVLHHGPHPWSAPTSLIELTDLSEQARVDLAGHLLSFRFVLHDLLTAPDEALDTPLLDPLPRLALGSMKYCKSQALGAFFLAHVEDVRQLLTSEHGRRSLFFILDYTDSVHPLFDRASLIRLLVPVVGLELAPAMLTYEELVDQKYEQRAYEKLCKRLAEDKQFAEEFLRKAMEEHVENAIVQGMEKRLETQRGQLRRLLARRFGALPDAVAARVAGAGAEDLDRWFDRLLDAASLDELFGEV